MKHVTETTTYVSLMKTALLTRNPDLKPYLVHLEYDKRNQVWAIELDPSVGDDSILVLQKALPGDFKIRDFSATMLDNIVFYVKGGNQIVRENHTTGI